MDLAQFEEVLDQYGGDIGSWPQNVRHAAHKLLDSNEDAQVLLAQQRELDSLLVEAMHAPPAVGLPQRIIDNVREQNSSWITIPWLSFIWKPALASAFSLTLGLYLGILDQDIYADIDEELISVAIYDIEEWASSDES